MVDHVSPSRIGSYQLLSNQWQRTIGSCIRIPKYQPTRVDPVVVYHYVPMIGVTSSCKDFNYESVVNYGNYQGYIDPGITIG